MRKPEKVQLVQELSDKLRKAQGFFLTDFSGLNVEQVTELRDKFRESDVEYKVVKNTLARLALKEAGIEGLDSQLVGPTAIALSYDDPATPAKIISAFRKTYKKLETPEVKVCVVENKVLSAIEAKELVNLPNRETLIAMLLGSLNAPVSGFVSVLDGVITKLVLTLKAIEEKKTEE